MQVRLPLRLRSSFCGRANPGSDRQHQGSVSCGLAHVRTRWHVRRREHACVPQGSGEWRRLFAGRDGGGGRVLLPSFVLLRKFGLSLSVTKLKPSSCAPADLNSLVGSLQPPRRGDSLCTESSRSRSPRTFCSFRLSPWHSGLKLPPWPFSPVATRQRVLAWASPSMGAGAFLVATGSRSLGVSSPRRLEPCRSLPRPAASFRQTALLWESASDLSYRIEFMAFGRTYALWVARISLEHARRLRRSIKRMISTMCRSSRPT